MKIDWGKSALFYCDVRIISNIVFATTLAVISLALSYKLNTMTKKDFSSTKAKILSVSLNEQKNIYYPIYKISFKNKNNKVVTKDVVNFTLFFTDKELANDFITKEKQKESIEILYSNKNPDDNIIIKGQEKFASSALFIAAISLVIFAILSYILMGNAIYCGFIIFRDIFTIFRF
jgi:energy-converting hydrogenase Eha subunit H